MKNKGIVMKLIYKTKIHRPNKYERFHNEYYQKGDIIEKYTISSTRVPGRLEKGETRRNDCKYLSASWHIQDPNMPQWLKQYIGNTSETHIEDLINELQKQGEVNILKKNEEYDKFYQKFYESYNSENAAGELNRFLLDVISKTKGTEKEYFVQLLEKVQNQDFTPELYANTLATIFTRERSKIH